MYFLPKINNILDKMKEMKYYTSINLVVDKYIEIEGKIKKKHYLFEFNIMLFR
jgi:hypothetical protein